MKKGCWTVWAAAHYVDFAAFPNLTAYQDRLAARAAYQQAQALEGVQQFYTRDFYALPEV